MVNKNKSLLALIAFAIVCIAYVGISGIIKRSSGEINPPASASELKGQNYEDVNTMMTEQGFTNVTIEPIDDLILGLLVKDGEVEEVSIDGYTSFATDSWFPPEAKVIIKYHTFKESDQVETATEEETINDEVKIDPAKGEQLTEVEEDNEEDPTKEELKQEENEPEESEIVATETVAETGETETNEPDETLVMPVMKGTNVDVASDYAEEYGLKQQFDDQDFGHGTMMRALSLDYGGLMLDIIYSTSTKEILSANIFTDLAATIDEQKSFIIFMSGVLCPESDKDEVTGWVESNVGGVEEITIGGFVYEVRLGAVENALYYAGERNWEEWDNSLD